MDKKNYTDSTNILSVCSGASTAAATGIYDNQPIATHASDFNAIKEQYPKPLWVSNTSVTNSNNLYSTAGVSNAVEGSLVLIRKMFGEESMNSVKKNINYPHPQIKKEHQSLKIRFNEKLTILKKVLFKKNNNIGVLLQKGIDEFELASILDTYNRTFPKSINSFTLNNHSVKSKFNLTLIPTKLIEEIDADEIHMPKSSVNLNIGSNEFGTSEIVGYRELNKYTVEQCLRRIEKQYGTEFKGITKLLLDYN